MAGPFDGNGKLALVLGTGAGNPAGNNFGALADVFPQAAGILVINKRNTVHAEAAYLAAAGGRAAAALVSLVSLISLISHTVYNLLSETQAALSVPFSSGADSPALRYCIYLIINTIKR
jgi:hypothetical protein